MYNNKGRTKICKRLILDGFIQVYLLLPSRSGFHVPIHMSYLLSKREVLFIHRNKLINSTFQLFEFKSPPGCPILNF